MKGSERVERRGEGGGKRGEETRVKGDDGRGEKGGWGEVNGDRRTKLEGEMKESQGQTVKSKGS